MEISEFKRVFQIASSQIINTAIKLGYINLEKKEELESKLNEYLQNDVAYEMKYKEEVAEFNPNTHTMAFNVSKISSVQEALVLILHEEKHILDYYVDEGRGFFDELYDHVGIQDKDENGIGQNESCTERFAVDVAEEILGERIETRKFQAIGLNFDSNMPNFHIEDYLNKLLCGAMQIPLGDLLKAQNGRSLEELGKIANSFNDVADYNKFRGAIDEIYRMIYVGDDSLFSAIYDENQVRGTVIQKKIDEYSDKEKEKIGRIHKLIQIAQNEIMQYISKTDPNRIDEIRSGFIVTAPEFELTEQDKIEFDSKYPKMDSVYSRREHIADNSISNFLEFIREEVETEEITTNTENLVNELGEKEYAKRLGEHVAMLMNKGYVCANFANNGAYGTFEVNNTLYLNINDIINNCDLKCDEINMQCSELKKNNPILIQYFDLDEQLYYLKGVVDDVETKRIVDEKKRKIEDKIKDILEEDKRGDNAIGKYLELRSKQSEIESSTYNQMSRYLRQFFYIGSLISDLQNQMNMEGKSKEEQETVLEAYIEGFKSSLNFEELAEVLGGNPIGTQNEFKRIFQSKKDIAQEIASEEQGNKSSLNGLIYQANEKYNEFYKMLSESMIKKFGNKEKTEEREENDEEIGGIIQEIKKIKLSEIPEGHDFFHFTRETAIPKIVKQGLRGDLENRENAVGKDYENPSIYFSKGETGLLKTVDVWLRWEYGRIAREKKTPDGSMITVPSVLEATFKRVLEDFKERRYFQLDLIEGEDKENTDFSYDSEDFKKKGAIDNGGPTRRTRWMLGSYTNWEKPKLEDWNMMTHVGGRRIGIDRMKMIVTEQGKSDALSVIEEIYERSRNKENIDLRYLDSFIKYVKILTKQQEENLTQNIGRSTVSELSKVEKMDRLTGFFQRKAREFNSINDEIEQE